MRADKLFYLQDARQIIGNTMLWWAKDHHGYTTDLAKAHVFTEDEITREGGFTDRTTDVAWPKEYIDERARLRVDVQITDQSQAIKGGEG